MWNFQLKMKLQSVGRSGNILMIKKRSISITKLIVKRMGGRFLAFYIRGSRIMSGGGDEFQS